MYFFVVYVAAEVLALPAVPLTASAGYLFGVAPGTAIVLLAAAVAASVSFLIGRTIGRDWILQVASGNDRFRALDSVISQEGFKIVLLLRLSPLFPFALSNYLYGLTSVPFWDYFWGTLLGYARTRTRAKMMSGARFACVARVLRMRGRVPLFATAASLRERRLTCTQARWARPCSAATAPGFPGTATSAGSRPSSPFRAC